MSGLLDEHVASLGGGWLFVAVIAAALGLRHATDADHLTAVLSLQLRGERRAPFRLGLAWGLGHAVTMVVIGVPLILFVAELPERVQQGLEIAVGVLIAVLAVRVLWSLAALHAHAHEHRHPDGLVHSHPHVHGSGAHAHRTRTPRSAFAIGLLHGAAGSAGVVALILTRLERPALACASLVVIAAFCALSMAVCSWALCRGLDHGARRVDPRWLAGAGGALSLAFGVVYAASAAGVGG